MKKSIFRKMWMLFVVMFMIIGNFQCGIYADDEQNGDTTSSYTNSVQMSSNLKDFVTNVTINNQDVTNSTDTITLVPGTKYTLGMTFKESNTMQFDHSQENLIYRFPSQINVPNSNGILPLTLEDKDNQTYEIDATYKIQDNKLYIDISKDDPDYSKLLLTDNVYMNIGLSFTLQNDIQGTEIDWGADKKTTINIDSDKDISVKKEGTYDKANGKFNYKVTVTSKGNNANVNVKDSLTGTAISYNNDLSAWSTVSGNAIGGTYTENPNGFTYVIPNMQDGEIIYLSYSANIDYTKLSEGDTFTVNETNNEVTVNADNVPEKTETKNFENVTKYNFISKSGELSEDSQTITWKIVVNGDAKTCVGGSSITDTIQQNSKVPMKYNGEGITIQRYDAQGNLAGDPFTVKWDELPAFAADSTWQYTLPNDTEPYKYVITYTTSVDNANIIDATSVKNTVTDDKDHTSSKTVTVKPGNTFEVQKTNSGINEDGAVDYTGKVTIPKTGFNEKLEVTDYLPKEGSNKYKDTFVENSLQVKLDENQLNEDYYTVTAIKKNAWDHDEVKLTFNNVSSLFSQSDTEHILTITYKTKVNSEWLGEHINNVDVNADGSNRKASSKVILANQSISKEGEQFGEIDGLPCYRFYVRLEGVDSESVGVDDVFNTNLLEFYNGDYQYSLLAGAGDEIWESKNNANYNNNGGNGGIVDAESSDTGMRFTLHPTKKDDGSYYRYYTIGYTLKVKDQDALKKIKQGAADNKGTYALSNQAIWGNHQVETHINYTVAPIKKTIEIPPTAENNYIATFKIDINPDALRLNNGNALTVQDEMSSNLRYISGSATVKKEEQEENIEPTIENNNKHLIWIIPDQTHVIITYKARIIGSGSVTYSNKVLVTNGYVSESKDNKVSITTSGSGGGSVNSITVIKRDADDDSKYLGGAKFQLYEKIGDTFKALKNKEGNDVIFVTSNDETSLGKLVISGSLSEDGWNLSDGNTYKLVEIKAPDGYQVGTETIFTFKDTPTAEDEYGNQDTIYIENTKKPIEKKQVKVRKIWEDNNNKNNNRPSSITVKLLANNIDTGKVLNLSEENKWSSVFGNLDKVDSNGKNITYSVSEESVTGYITRISGNQTDGYVLTNTLETTSFSGAKTWDDANDQDGFRPEKITVHLFSEDKEVASKTVTEKDNWKYSFDNLPKYKDGKEIEYKVTEDSVEGYDTTIQGTEISNKHLPEKTQITVKKSWDDNNNQDGKRPESIEVQLYADGNSVENGNVILNEENQWKHTFNDLPKYSAGKEIAYTVQEVNVPDGYAVTVSCEENSSVFTITNTHTPETTEITGTKTWDDGNNQDGKRPESIKVNLLANGKQIDSKTVTSTDEWKYTFSNLPKYANGEVIEYTIDEDEVPEYSSKIDGYYIINSYTPGKTSVNVTKEWKDEDNQDGIRPTSVSVQLYADGEKIGETVELNTNNEWQHTFNDLPEKKNGRDIVYTVKELTKIDGYTSTVIHQENSNNFIIKNTHEIEKTSISGKKIWMDNDNQDGLRPESVTVNLLKDNQVINARTITAKDDWKYEFNDLPKYENGKEIKYSVSEENVEGYTSSIAGYDITNTHVPETTQVSGVKKWNDSNNQDGLRPKSIVVNLYANGDKIDYMRVTETDNWKYSFDNLPVYKNGKKIVYTIREEDVEGYKSEVNGYNLINTYKPATTSISVMKFWDDGNNQDGIRPTSVSVQLYADGEKIDDTVALNTENNWQYTFNDLPEKKDGKLIHYTVKEIDNPKGYKSTVKQKENNTFVITNEHEPVVTEVSGTKTWNDDNNKFQKRPSSITVTLYKDDNDEPIQTQVVKPSLLGSWKYSFTNLPKYENGNEIQYYVREDAIDDYIASYEAKAITNTLKTTDVEISKVDITKQNELAGAELEIVDAANDSKVYDSWISTSEVHKVKLPSGQYRLVELSAPENYEKAQSIHFTIDKEGNVSSTSLDIVNGNKIIMVDAYSHHDVQISKTAINGKELDGAHLSITGRAFGSGTDIDKISWISDSKKQNIVSLKPGEYMLHEDSAPEGYTVASDISFTVDAEGKITVNDETVDKVTMVDTKTSISVSKVDGNDGHVLEGAHFQILNGDEVVNEWDSTSEAYTVEGLATNVPYVLRETKAPEGYLSAQDIPFQISADGSVVSDALEDGKLVVKDTPISSTSYSVKKEWSDNGTTGVVFPESVHVKLMEKCNGIESVVEEADLNVDNGWSITWNDLATTDEAGTTIQYYAVEDEVAGYNSVNAISSDENGTYQTITNTYAEGKEVTISKEDVGGNTIGGANLSVKDANGNVIASWTTVENENKAITITPGTYTLHEDSAPEGYTVASDIAFTVDENGIVTVDGKVVDSVVMVDTFAVHNVRIDKVNSVTGKNIAGAKLNIVDSDNKKVDEWTSDENTHVISLKSGKYTLVEEKAPNGYKVAEKISFEISDNGEILVDGRVVDSVVMKDIPDSKITDTSDHTNIPFFGVTGLMSLLFALAIMQYRKRNS